MEFLKSRGTLPGVLYIWSWYLGRHTHLTLPRGSLCSYVDFQVLQGCSFVSMVSMRGMVGGGRWGGADFAGFLRTCSVLVQFCFSMTWHGSFRAHRLVHSSSQEATCFRLLQLGPQEVCCRHFCSSLFRSRQSFPIHFPAFH